MHRERVAPNAIRMGIEVPDRVHTAPGQFLHVLCGPGPDPLLRRPFSVYAESPARRGTRLDILFTVVGKGTEELARRKVGDTVGVLGPLGNSFTDGPADVKVFVAGGVGIVPFYLFAERSPGKILLLFGARRADQLYGARDWDALGVEWKAATEDGSRGFRGLVTGLLVRELRRLRGRRVRVYTCGPDAMMRVVIRICRRRGLACQASLERRMGCALGACGACATPVQDGGDWRYSRICIEGPVVNGVRIVLA